MMLWHDKIITEATRDVGSQPRASRVHQPSQNGLFPRLLLEHHLISQGKATCLQAMIQHPKEL